MAHARASGAHLQDRTYLSKLHSSARHLDLVITPPEQHERTVPFRACIKTRDVTREVASLHAPARTRAWDAFGGHSHHKAFGREGIIIEVAARERLAADAKLTRRRERSTRVRSRACDRHGVRIDRGVGEGSESDDGS